MTAPHLPQTIPSLVPDHPVSPRQARTLEEKPMFATITIAGSITAQGPVSEAHADGRVTITDGLRRLTGWPVTRLRALLSAAALAMLAFGAAPVPVAAETLLNLSYDPTREP